MTRPSAVRRITAALLGSSPAPGRARLAVRTRELPAARRIAAAVLGVPLAPPVAARGAVLSTPEKAAGMPATVTAPSPAPSPARKWRQLVYVLLAAGAVPACLWLTAVDFSTPSTCVAANGLERIGGECVGVNGDGYDFGTPEIGDVSRAIAQENSAIEGEPHVTVAMMLPLKPDQKAQRRQMRSDLQGAYLGQREANEGAATPKIRLVLANPGRNYGQQEKVVDTLLKMADSRKDRLRAVTGFGSGTGATEQAVERLTKHRIPVLASQTGVDRIANGDRRNGDADRRYPGLVGISPTDREVARALADFTGERARQDRKTVLVYDRRRDAYSKSLMEAFAGIDEKGAAGPAAMPFESRGAGELGAVPNQFAQIVNNICASEADTVYFAGRAVHLRAFVHGLAQAGCQDRDFTIVSGSDAASLPQTMAAPDWADLRGGDGESRITLQYAVPAHPDAWRSELARWKESSDKKPPQYLTEPEAALNDLKKRIGDTRREGVRLGAAPDLEDSRTMLAYDGLITIGKALHNAQADAAGKAINREDVVNQWPLLNSRNRVQGATGLICLTSDGNPYDKPVPVVELDPGKKGWGKPRFVGLGWPAGRGQPQNCVVPGGQ